MDFIKRVAEYIETNLTLFVEPLSFSKLRRQGNDIAIRITPSSPTDYYMSGKEHQIGFQILVKHSDDKEAYDTTQSITTLLDGLSNDEIVSSDGSFSLIKCEVYTLPNWIEDTSHGESIYTAMFRANIYL